MKRLCLVIAAAAAAAATACAPAPEQREFKPVASAGEYQELVAGKPMTFENGGTLITNPDGTLGGDFNGAAPQGSWAFENGQLCRTVTIGTQSYPEVCQAVEVGEETVRFFNPDGTLAAEATLG